MHARRSVFWLSLFFLLLPQPGFTSQAPLVDPSAQAAAVDFLELLDLSEFEQAWNRTSLINQSYLVPPDWFQKLRAVRPHLGPVASRTLQAVSLHDGWVGLPDANYIRLSFASVFLNKQESLETVLVVWEGGAWSVSSYHLR